MAQLAQSQTSNDKAGTAAIVAPKYCGCEESKAILNGIDENVVCMIRRKRASNLVVYRANTIIETDENGNDKISLHSKHPIDIFWLKLSKQDLKKHRESGKMDDKVVISQIERKLCYGVTCKKNTNINTTNQKKSIWASIKSKKTKKNTTITNNNSGEVSDIFEDDDSYSVVFNALKSMNMKLRIDHETNTPNLYGQLMSDGKEIECILKEIWVTMRKSRNLKIPKIDYLTIKANKCDNKQPIEYIMKK